MPRSSQHERRGGAAARRRGGAAARRRAFILELSGQVVDQPVEEGQLGLDDLRAGEVEVEPGGPVDLRELLDAARPRRPLQLEGVAGDGIGVQVTLPRPDSEQLAPLHLAERIQPRCGHRAAELLGELAPGCSLAVLVRIVLALRDRPGAVVLLRPERAAHVTQQHLDPPARTAVQQDTGAADGRHADQPAGRRGGRRCPGQRMPGHRLTRSATLEEFVQLKPACCTRVVRGLEPLGDLELARLRGGVTAGPRHHELGRLIQQVLGHAAVLPSRFLQRRKGSRPLAVLMGARGRAVQPWRL